MEICVGAGGQSLGLEVAGFEHELAVELDPNGTVRPRALMLENVRGLSLPRFSACRQHVLDRRAQLGYAADWRLLHASDYGVPQLRPRFVLVAMRPEDFRYFSWPQPRPELAKTVGATLRDLMSENGWPGADKWAEGGLDNDAFLVQF